MRALVFAASAFAAAVGSSHASSVSWGDPGVPAVALTFDAGYDGKDAPRILEVLDRRGVRGTFFFTGTFLKANASLAREIAAAGHEAANHCWTHKDCTKNPGGLAWSLTRTRLLYESLTGRPMSRLWRAPYGKVDARTLRCAEEVGYRHVGWSLDTVDWAGPGEKAFRDPGILIARVRSQREGVVVRGRRVRENLNGAIFLMHLTSKSGLAARLDELLDVLEEADYRVVPLSDLPGVSRAARVQAGTGAARGL